MGGLVRTQQITQSKLNNSLSKAHYEKCNKVCTDFGNMVGDLNIIPRGANKFTSARDIIESLCFLFESLKEKESVKKSFNDCLNEVRYFWNYSQHQQACKIDE